MKLSVEGLAAERGGRTVFKELSFTVEAGTLLYVTGRNGAGKTTLLRILAALGAATDGTVRWEHDGHAVLPNEAACFVGHAHGFNDMLTVRENLEYVSALAGHRTTPTSLERALAALGVAGLARRRFGALSQGQRKRCALARLIAGEGAESVDAAMDGRAWLLDEPFAALDAGTQQLLADLMAAKLRAGGLVIYSSHQAVEIAAAQTQELML